MNKLHLDTIKCLALAALIFLGFAAQSYSHFAVTQDHFSAPEQILS